jgi:hypothetical protein
VRWQSSWHFAEVEESVLHVGLWAPGADSEEKHEPARDIDAAVVDSLKVLDPKRPIRETDMLLTALRGRLMRQRAGSYTVGWEHNTAPRRIVARLVNATKALTSVIGPQRRDSSRSARQLLAGPYLRIEKPRTGKCGRA